MHRLRHIVLPIAACALATLVAAGCGKFGEVSSGDGGKTTGNKGKSDVPTIPGVGEFDAASRKAYDCTDIEELKNRGRSHVETTEQVKYKDNPPASGNHWNAADPQAPLPWGVYTDEVQDEQWIHNLEHGHVVIAYKGISDPDLEKLLKQRGYVKYHLVVVPRKDNPKKGIYYLSWDHRMFCKRPSPEALQHFIDERIDQGPELMMEDPSRKAS